MGRLLSHSRKLPFLNTSITSTSLTESGNISFLKDRLISLSGGMLIALEN